MKLFQCGQCHQPVYFENSLCSGCGAGLGFLFSKGELISVTETSMGIFPSNALDVGPSLRYCQNHDQGACNWFVSMGSNDAFCEACNLNRVIPNLENRNHLEAWTHLEQAKRRVVYALKQLNLPIESKMEFPERGVCFEFLSDAVEETGGEPVLTGHSQGVITINIAEADPVYRERMRKRMNESYRTVIGHFRHELGHFYWDRLIRQNESLLAQFRELFGDERIDYAESLERHYRDGPPHNWSMFHVSAYSSVHPWEDWAETWAHYLHIVSTLETAYSFGVSLTPMIQQIDRLKTQIDFNPYLERDFKRIYEAYVPITLAINSLNRSMGQPDIYPFVVPAPTVERLAFVHDVVAGAHKLV